MLVQNTSQASPVHKGSMLAHQDQWGFLWENPHAPSLPEFFASSSWLSSSVLIPAQQHIEIYRKFNYRGSSQQEKPPITKN